MMVVPGTPFKTTGAKTNVGVAGTGGVDDSAARVGRDRDFDRDRVG